MREILFRGKRIDNGEWVYGAFVPDALEQTHGEMVTWGFIRRHQPNRTVESVEMIEVHRCTIGQYTGLHDKNGKRIFEGDVVEMHRFLFDGSEYEHETKGAIKWGEYGWLLSQIEGEAVNEYMGYKNGEGETYFINFYGLHEESFEVIGTIHDEVSP